MKVLEICSRDSCACTKEGENIAHCSIDGAFVAWAVGCMVQQCSKMTEGLLRGAGSYLLEVNTTLRTSMNNEPTVRQSEEDIVNLNFEGLRSSAYTRSAMCMNDALAGCNIHGECHLILSRKVGLRNAVTVV